MSRTPKAQALGRAMRQLRENAGLTTRALGELLGGVNCGEISRWETGDRAPRPEDVARILTKFNVTGDRYDEIMTVAYDVFRSEWVAVTSPARRQHRAAFIDFERESSKITAVSVLLVPGMVQTQGYAEGIMSQSDQTAAEKAELVETRDKRKENLYREFPVTQYQGLIGLAALQLIIGSKAVMIEQIRI
jgi:transcriptional regulator with XRE-family HTH domain